MGLGGVIIFENESETIDFPYLNCRNKMLEHLTPHDRGPVEPGL